MEIVCALVFFLAAVTVIGPGIWVLLARIFAPPAENSLEKMRCERCLSIKNNGRRICDVCGWPEPVPAEPGGVALVSLMSQLQRYRELGMLDQLIEERLMRAIEEERAKPAPEPVRDDIVETPLSADQPLVADSAADPEVVQQNVAHENTAEDEGSAVVMAEIVDDDGGTEHSEPGDIS